jgi:hypothetical protein
MYISYVVAANLHVHMTEVQYCHMVAIKQLTTEYMTV